MRSKSGLTIRVAEEEICTIVSLIGNVDTGSAADIRRRIRPLCEIESPRVLIDCGEVAYLNSSCFGQFSALCQLCAEHGGKMVLCDVDTSILDIMKLLGLQDIIPVHESVEDGRLALQL